MRRISAFTDKSASLELKRQLEKLVALRMAGAGPDAELSRFLESSPAKIRENLGKWGIIAGERAAAGKALPVHIAEWQESMTADGLTRKQIVANENTENPPAYLSKLNADTDRRRERHAFTIAELGRIIAAAEAGSAFLTMTGHERALVYRLAATSGLRWSEIRSLTRASFDFAGETATVTITAAYAKNRKEEVLPLRPEVAADLKAQMALSLPSAKTFSGMQPTGGAEMLRFDLEAAGIPYIDEYGRVGDFHALRHTYGTLLNQAGVPLATAQKLMRHSTPMLTANVYTHIMVETKAEALAKLPEIISAAPENESAARTGTDDMPFLQVGNYADRPGDSNGDDFNRRITTCSDNRKCEKENDAQSIETKNPPARQGETIGGETGIATLMQLVLKSDIA